MRELENLRGGNAEQNAKIIEEVLNGKRKDAARSLVLMNAAAGILIGGKAGNFKEALQFAAESLDSGNARKMLGDLIELTNGK
jgi:anthranilate phosphoribosyltransferase